MKGIVLDFLTFTGYIHRTKQSSTVKVKCLSKTLDINIQMLS